MDVLVCWGGRVSRWGQVIRLGYRTEVGNVALGGSGDVGVVMQLI